MLHLPAPAKINLFLHVLGRREDGYHSLETLFQLLDWGDELHFELSDGIEFSQSPNTDFPSAENLVVRAANLLRQETDSNKGARIHLDKRIPMGAGLGGGSSDAATTLLALNKLWHLNLDMETLCELGIRLGADVPVFLRGHSAYATGVGEKLQPVSLEQRWYLVVTPDIHVSTASIFNHPDLIRNGKSLLKSEGSQDIPLTAQLTEDMRNSKIRALADLGGRNDCQTVVEKLHQGVADMRILLEEFGPTKMSGTGSSLFLTFKQKKQAEQAMSQLGPKVTDPHHAFIAQAVNRSAVHEELARCQTL